MPRDPGVRKSSAAWVAEHARTQPDKLAVITPEGRMTYGELFRLSLGYGRCLASSGVRRGDILLVRASQTLEYPVIYLGAHLAGAVVAALERNVPDEGMLSAARKLRARVILSEEALGDYPALYLPRRDVLGRAGEHGGAEPPERFPELEDLAEIMFTTGTTGASKGVMLTHRALAATAENIIHGCQYQEDTVHIVPGPLNHTAAVRRMAATFARGSTIYLLNGMTNLKEFFTALEEANACCLPPALIRALFFLSGDKIGQYADRIDFIESTSSPLPEPDKARLCRLLPRSRLYNVYGASEAASICIYDYNAEPGRENCVGRVMPNARVTIVDEQRREIRSSRAEMGFIACAGDVVMSGYADDPEQTGSALDHGTLYTSDLGYIEEGWVYVVGRKGDVINVGGLKVAPSEVESAALARDGVTDCACVAVPDRITGSALKLLVVSKEDIDAREFSAFLSHRLESYKVPKLYERVEKVKRTYNGKIDRAFYRP